MEKKHDLKPVKFVDTTNEKRFNKNLHFNQKKDIRGPSECYNAPHMGGDRPFEILWTRLDRGRTIF